MYVFLYFILFLCTYLIIKLGSSQYYRTHCCYDYMWWRSISSGNFTGSSKLVKSTRYIHTRIHLLFAYFDQISYKGSFIQNNAIHRVLDLKPHIVFVGLICGLINDSIVIASITIYCKKRCVQSRIFCFFSPFFNSRTLPMYCYHQKS